MGSQEREPKNVPLVSLVHTTEMEGVFTSTLLCDLQFR